MSSSCEFGVTCRSVGGSRQVERGPLSCGYTTEESDTQHPQDTYTSFDCCNPLGKGVGLTRPYFIRDEELTAPILDRPYVDNHGCSDTFMSAIKKKKKPP